MKIGIANSATNAPPIMLELFDNSDVGTLKSMIEVELRIPYLRQSLWVPGKHKEGYIRDDHTLQNLLLVDGDIIVVNDKGSSTRDGKKAAPGSPMDPVANHLVEQSKKERGYLNKLRDKQPELADAVERLDIKGIGTCLNNILNKKKTKPANQEATSGDPFLFSFKDPAQPQVYVQAVPYYVAQPYYFDPSAAIASPTQTQGHTALLYAEVAINNVPIKAFINCSAQSSTISEHCAMQCNVLGQLDRRYQGYTGGPGSAPIVGRLHCVEVNCSGRGFGASFSVVQSTVPNLLLGLDFFKRHQCCIDLRYNCLRVGDATVVPFLSPAEVQKSLNDDILRSLLDQPPTELHPSSFNPSARSSDYNFTVGSGVPMQMATPGNYQTPLAPLPGQVQTATTHQTRLTPPTHKQAATIPSPLPPSQPTVSRHPPPDSYHQPPDGFHQIPDSHHQPPAGRPKATHKPELAEVPSNPELNIQHSGRVHQQIFDEKNVGGKLIEETKITQLTNLGFEKAQAQEALRKCQGNTELAAAVLFQSRAPRM